MSTFAPPAPAAAGTTLRGRTLVLGGARSGKSAYAESMLAGESAVTYVATGGARDDDPEWQRRVAAHRARRPPDWRTVETADLPGVLRTADTPLLVDCLSLWLAAVMDATGAWEGDVTAARSKVDELLESWAAAAAPVVGVSNEVGSGIVPATASGRLYRDELGRLNRLVADAAERVVLVVAGQPLRLKPAVGLDGPS